MSCVVCAFHPRETFRDLSMKGLWLDDLFTQQAYPVSTVPPRGHSTNDCSVFISDSESPVKRGP